MYLGSVSVGKFFFARFHKLLEILGNVGAVTLGGILIRGSHDQIDHCLMILPRLTETMNSEEFRVRKNCS